MPTMQEHNALSLLDMPDEVCTGVHEHICKLHNQSEAWQAAAPPTVPAHPVPAPSWSQPPLQTLPGCVVQVLTLCMQGLSSPGDLASLVLACKRLARLGAEAPVGLRLQEQHLPPCTPAEARHKLRGIWSCFPGPRMHTCVRSGEG